MIRRAGAWLPLVALWAEAATGCAGGSVLTIADEVGPPGSCAEVGASGSPPCAMRAAQSGRACGDWMVAWSPSSPRGREALQEALASPLVVPWTTGYGLAVQVHEVTQLQWRTLMGSAPSYFSECGDRCPVERVSWFDALVYLNRLSDLAGLERCYALEACSGDPTSSCAADRPWCDGGYECELVTYRGTACAGFRLPTLQEWRAVVAATATDLRAQAAGWCAAVSGGSPRAADRTPDWIRRADALAGNVWEWLWDESSPAAEHLVAAVGADEVHYLGDGARGARHRLHAGGAWSSDAEHCHVAALSEGRTSLRAYFVGFRPVRTLLQERASPACGLPRSPVTSPRHFATSRP